MLHSKRLFILIWICFVTFIGLGWWTLSMEAAQDDESVLRGEACGSGELLPDTTICLHGFVLQEQVDGTFAKVNGAVISVRAGNHVVTGTTYVHPGHLAPHYGIDISPLQPAYLKPVTVTVSYAEQESRQQIIVFPDYATLSQQHDIWLRTIDSFDETPVWGQIVDFETGGVVADAVVTATFGTRTVTVVTTNSLGVDTNPIYQFTNSHLQYLGVDVGDTIHIEATYNGNSASRLVTLVEDERHQLDLILGWRCADFDPLPRTQGGWGFPRTQGGWGFPDMACFWGTVKVAGDYPEGVEVQLTISETTYTAVTRQYPGETVPRYAISLMEGSMLDGHSVTAVVLYQGVTSVDSALIELDNTFSQNIDLSIKPSKFTNVANSNFVKDLLWYGRDMWAATGGGGLVWSLEPYSNDKLSTIDGLSSNNVQAVEMDNHGNLWFGTFGNGISKYNLTANSWTNITIANGLVSNYINTIHKDNQGRLWLGTQEGISVYDPFADSWTTFTTTHGLIDDHILAIHEDVNSNMWFGTQQGGISVYNPVNNDWSSFTKATGLSGHRVNTIDEDKDGKIWVGTNNGVNVYDPTDGNWEAITTADGLISNYVQAIYVDSLGHIWFGTRYGVSRYDPQDKLWVTYTTINGLVKNDVRAIQEDHQNNIWIATYGGGINVYNLINEDWKTLAAGNRIQAIHEDSHGNMWIGTHTEGIRIYNRAEDSWSTLSTVDGLVHRNVQTIQEDSHGNIWIGTWDGMSMYSPTSNQWTTFTEADGLSDNNVVAIQADNLGHIWSGTKQTAGTSELNLYDSASKRWVDINVANTIDTSLWTVYVDSLDKVWVGTTTGIGSYNPVNNRWTDAFIRGGGISLKNVMAIHEDSQGNIWAGTFGQGVGVFDPSSRNWRSFTIENGLASNEIKSILEDSFGNVWLGTDNGASVYNPSNHDWRTFDVTNGLVNNNIWAMHEDSQGNIWIATAGGVTVFEAPWTVDFTVSLAGNVQAWSEDIVDTTVQLRNRGIITSPVSLTLTLPASTTVLQADAPFTQFDDLPIQQVVWSWPEVAPQSTLTIGLEIQLGDGWTEGDIHHVTAQVSTAADETYLDNNIADWTMTLVEPRADVGIELESPPMISTGETTTVHILVDNAGELLAEDSQVTLTLPSQLQYIHSSPLSVSDSPLAWDIGSLEPQEQQIITVIVQAASDLTDLVELTAAVTTSTNEHSTTNNIVTHKTPVSLAGRKTLILVAPERLRDAYGTTPVMATLSTFAEHPAVMGVIVDVLDDPEIAAVYGAWEAQGYRWRKGNDVAKSIKALIVRYTQLMPDLEYITLVGGDEQIPFYRIKDRNRTQWHEVGYGAYIGSQAESIRSAFQAGNLLTDDFYANQTQATPSSSWWEPNHPFYLPDLKIGRLVETPEEIVKVLQTFLENDGRLDISMLVTGGFDSQLAYDMADAMCQSWLEMGISASCTMDSQTFKSTVLNQTTGLVVSAFHSNHQCMGDYGDNGICAKEIAARTVPANELLVTSIGCHAGLNVEDGEGEDFPQAWSQQGATYIAPSAYGYGSPWGISYSERFLDMLTDMLYGDVTTVGQALLATKHRYYNSLKHGFDHIDEKVSSAMTLYGPPMLRLESTTEQRQARVQLASPLLITQTEQTTTAVYQIAPDLIQETTEFGEYWRVASDDANNNPSLHVRHHRPLQPAWETAIPFEHDGKTIRNLIWRRLEYEDLHEVDPVVNESWSLSNPQSSGAEPAINFTGWERAWPCDLGVVADDVRLSCVLGSYHVEEKVERLFKQVDVEVRYSANSDDITAPIVQQALGVAYTTEQRTVFVVIADDDIAVSEVVVLYDTGHDVWDSVSLTQNEGVWRAEVPITAERYLVQILDQAQNLTATEWAPVESSTMLHISLASQQIRSQTVWLPLALYALLILTGFTIFWRRN